MTPGHRLFFHSVYHPLDISRWKIWTAYEKTCNNKNTATDYPPFSAAIRNPPCRITNILLAQSLPNNLRNLPTLPKLHEIQGCRLSYAIATTNKPSHCNTHPEGTQQLLLVLIFLHHHNFFRKKRFGKNIFRTLKTLQKVSLKNSTQTTDLKMINKKDQSHLELPR